MKKFQLLVFVFCCFLTSLASAQTLVTTDAKNDAGVFRFVSYRDYFPFFKFEDNRYYTVFEPLMKKFGEMFDYKPQLYAENYGGRDYEGDIFLVRRGKVNALLGMYHDTKTYSGLEYMYPAVIDNPVHIVMPPSKIASVTSVEDLKKLKGIYNKNEYFSDFVLSHFKDLGLEEVSSSQEAFEKLITGQKDYLLGSYYYNYGEVVRLGLKSYLSFSKTALWNMPVFIGLSKSSMNHAQISKNFKDFMLKEDYKDLLAQRLKQMMNDYEKRYQGTVPPKFVRTDQEAESGGVGEVR